MVRHALDRGVLSNRPEYTGRHGRGRRPGHHLGLDRHPAVHGRRDEDLAVGQCAGGDRGTAQAGHSAIGRVRFTPMGPRRVVHPRQRDEPAKFAAARYRHPAGRHCGIAVLQRRRCDPEAVLGSAAADLPAVRWPTSTVNSPTGRSSGIKLPDDLQTLFGKQFDLVVSEMMDAEKKVPQIGVRMRTDTAKAGAILTKVKALMSGSSGQAPQTTKDGRVYLALNQSYLDDSSRPGSLGDTVNAAVPDLGKSTMVLWINLDKLLEQYYIDTVPADQREAVRALKGIAVSSCRAAVGCHVHRSTANRPSLTRPVRVCLLIGRWAGSSRSCRGTSQVVRVTVEDRTRRHTAPGVAILAGPVDNARDQAGPRMQGQPGFVFVVDFPGRWTGIREVTTGGQAVAHEPAGEVGQPAHVRTGDDDFAARLVPAFPDPCFPDRGAQIGASNT